MHFSCSIVLWLLCAVLLLAAALPITGNMQGCVAKIEVPLTCAQFSTAGCGQGVLHNIACFLLTSCPRELLCWLCKCVRPPAAHRTLRTCRVQEPQRDRGVQSSALTEACTSVHESVLCPMHNI